MYVANNETDGVCAEEVIMSGWGKARDDQVGLIYDGEFLNGLPHGRGVMTKISAAARKRAERRGEEMNCAEEFEWRYDGEWRHGKQNGLGTMDRSFQSAQPHEMKVAMGGRKSSDDGNQVPTLPFSELFLPPTPSAATAAVAATAAASLGAPMSLSNGLLSTRRGGTT